jgi:hypothetical protein
MAEGAQGGSGDGLNKTQSVLHHAPPTPSFHNPPQHTPIGIIQRAYTGEEHPYCAALIEAHKACLRLEGFNV